MKTGRDCRICWSKPFIRKVAVSTTKRLSGSGGPVHLIRKLVAATYTFPHPEVIVDDYINLRLDRELSGRTFLVYYNPTKKIVYLVHAPTDPASMEDIVADVLLSISIHSKRVKHSIDLQFKAERKYSRLGYKISTLGYSLGSYAASEAKKQGARSLDWILIGHPIVPSNMRDKVSDNVYRIRSTRDGVNFLYPFASKGIHDINIKAKTLNPAFEHKDVNTLPRLPQQKMIGIDLVGSGLEKEIKSFRKPAVRAKKSKKKK